MVKRRTQSATLSLPLAEQASAPLRMAQDAPAGVRTGLRTSEGPRGDSGANTSPIRPDARGYYAVKGRGACLVVLVECAGKDALGPGQNAPGCVGVQHCPPPVEWWVRVAVLTPPRGHEQHLQNKGVTNGTNR